MMRRSMWGRNAIFVTRESVKTFPITFKASNKNELKFTSVTPEGMFGFFNLILSTTIPLIACIHAVRHLTV